RDGGLLHDRALRCQVPVEDGDAALLVEGTVQRPYDLLIDYLRFICDLVDALPGYGTLVGELTLKALEHRRNAARPLQVLYVIRPRRTDGGDVAGLPGDLVEGAEIDLYPEIVRYSGNVQRGVGGAPYGHVHPDSVEERAAVHEASGGHS